MSAHVGGFVELLGRSAFSFLEASSMPEELVEAAHGLGIDAIALCDRDGIYGLPRAYAQGKKLGMPVIVGAELTLEGPWPGGEPPERDAPPGDPPTTLALLAEDHAGYGHLCKHLTAAHADHDKGEAGITLGEIAAATAGLSALVPLGDAWVARAEHAADLDAFLGPVRDAFGDRAAIATWRRFDGLDRRREALAHAVSQRFALPVVASARPRFHHPSRKPLADVMFCIKHKTTLDAAGTILAANAEAGLRTAAQMRALFRDRPDWVRASLDIADRCRFSLGQLRYAFPSDTLCRPGESPDEALRRLTEDGCRTRYPGGVPPTVRAQIDKELALIAQLGVAPYFMSVRQVVEMARARRILCQGRGSAANSAVCFALGITAVDPARSNLLFERFLSAERAEPPDIDVDFEHERREEVIQDIYETYGRDRAAMVSTLICYRGKSALREVGKVFGLSVDQVERLSGLVMHYEFEGNPERIAETGLDPDDPRLRRVVMMAGALEGFPRHLSIHVGGFVLSSQPLHLVAPVEPARMEGRTVIPWDKDDIDDLGFFKVDVLGLGMLTAIRKCLAMVHARRAEVAAARGETIAAFDPIEALAEVPPEVPEVYDAVCRADTIGVFQIESRAQMAMLPRLRPRRFYDLVIEVAIVRPGPIQGGMVHPYLRRRTGKEVVTTPHPCLDPILERTLGVPLFQEQVMQIAMTGAGYTAGEADQLRRDMAAWKRHGRLERHRIRLLEGFSQRGISATFAEQIYQQVQGFGEYGFPESHAASFALLVYVSSWQKVFHPAAFACALLNAQPMGFYSPSSIVRDAQAHGVTVRPVCVLASDWDNLLEYDDEASGARALPLADAGGAAPPGPDGEGQPAIRLGMRQVKGFPEAAAQALVAARREAPFRSLADLVQRTGLKKNEVEVLAEAGALAALVPERREALWRARAPRAPGLFEGLPMEEDRDVGLPALGAVDQLILDYGRTGLSIEDHPMNHIRPRFGQGRGRERIHTARDLLRTSHGRNVVVAGLVIGRQRPATASGVTFITLEDETGVINLVVHKRIFTEQYLVARHAKIVLVRGRVEREGDVIHVLVRKMERLDLPGDEPLPARSRDFH